MKHEYSLAHLTMLALPSIRVIDAVALAGYAHVSLRLTRVTLAEILYPVITDRTLVKETKARLAATGLSVCDVEPARMAPESDPESYIPPLEATAELGSWTSDRPLKQTGSANLARKLPLIVGHPGAFSILSTIHVSSDTLVIAIMAVAFFSQGMTGPGWTLISDVAPKNLAFDWRMVL